MLTQYYRIFCIGVVVSSTLLILLILAAALQKNTLDPVWNEAFLLGPFTADHASGCSLHVTVFDEDRSPSASRFIVTSAFNMT